jgi:hypothetical protein
MTDLAKPGELWTLGQALVWITCTTGDLASPTERDDLIASSGAPKVGENELLPFTLFEACQRWEKVQNDLAVEPSQFRTETGEMLSLRFRGKKLNAAWEAAMSSLNAEVNRGQIDLFALNAFTPGLLERVDRFECASLILGEAFRCTIAKRAYSHHETRWRSLRFEAAQIVARWPTNKSESNKIAKGGRPPAADWAALKDTLRREIEQVGFPSRDHEPEWRTQADVERWIAARTGEYEPGKTALRDNTNGYWKNSRPRWPESSFRPKAAQSGCRRLTLWYVLQRPTQYCWTKEQTQR